MRARWMVVFVAAAALLAVGGSAEAASPSTTVEVSGPGALKKDTGWDQYSGVVVTGQGQGWLSIDLRPGTVNGCTPQQLPGTWQWIHPDGFTSVGGTATYTWTPVIPTAVPGVCPPTGSVGTVHVALTVTEATGNLAAATGHGTFTGGSASIYSLAGSLDLELTVPVPFLERSFAGALANQGGHDYEGPVTDGETLATARVDLEEVEPWPGYGCPIPLLGGTFTLVEADGSSLSGATGAFLAPSVWVPVPGPSCTGVHVSGEHGLVAASMTITGGTGRYAGATGRAELSGVGVGGAAWVAQIDLHLSFP